MLNTAFRIVNYFRGSITCQRRVTQPTFAITSVSLVYVGETVILPHLYTKWGHAGMIPALQWFGYYIALQVLINWLCVKFVQSKYDPLIHGAEKINYNKRYPSSSDGVDTIQVEADDKSSQRLVTFYFAWSYCIRCDKPRPPRCHHCPICQMCVLKRDHHCFLTDVCIGYRNLRHFTVFLFWTAIGSIFCTFHMAPYYVKYVLPHTPLVSSNPFAGSYNMTLFEQNIQWIFLTLLSLFLIFFSCWSFYYFHKVIGLLLAGKTSFEVDADLKIRDDRKWPAKMKSVFGRYWVLNFLVPLHCVYEPIDDPAYWPYIK